MGKSSTNGASQCWNVLSKCKSIECFGELILTFATKWITAEPIAKFVQLQCKRFIGFTWRVGVGGLIPQSTYEHVYTSHTCTVHTCQHNVFHLLLPLIGWRVWLYISQFSLCEPASRADEMRTDIFFRSIFSWNVLMCAVPITQRMPKTHATFENTQL